MRVGIVNDQQIAVETLRRVVLSDPRHEIAWVARDGDEAVRRCRADRPDVVLMDLVMPQVNGAEATRQIMRESPLAILVVTSGLCGNFQLVCDAMSAGAYDAVTTPVLGNRPPAEAGAELLAKLAAVDRINRRLQSVEHFRSECDGERRSPSEFSVPLVAIGTSTGGPLALATILGELPADFPAAVLIVQHIGEEHAPCLTTWLQARARLTVRNDRAGDRPAPVTLLLSASTHHLVMLPDGLLAYTSEPADYPYRPSVDVLFHSLAKHGPSKGVAALLTGIGRDGAQG